MKPKNFSIATLISIFMKIFLKAWDSETRKARGVYYTPPPVVQFIVGAIDDILRDDFKIEEGLGDYNLVTALDFAAGTGTFLLEIFQHILDNTDVGNRALLIKKHLLKNLYGFEYLIAPYTIAHLKLSRFLSQHDYEMDYNERLQIYLTNTLEQIEGQGNLLLPALREEGKTAYNIKAKKSILVITGNPPYAVNSSNNSEWISNLIDDYKFIDGVPLGEKNSKLLQDDYVKFIRFAQYKMDAVDEGVVGIITNHSYLDNITFRGMRHNLMQSFDRIYLLDLHGNSTKKETAPDGGKDDNVFDIKQGVAIAIFVKRKGLSKGVFHADSYGKRYDKYLDLLQADFKKFRWQEITPNAPNYYFIPQDETLRDEYEQGKKITDIFPINGNGIKSHRDHFAFAFDADEMQARIDDILGNKSDKALQWQYDLKDTRDWQFSKARDMIKRTQDEDIEKKILRCQYRPFDKRYCYYGTETMDWPRDDVMRHMLAGDNIGLIGMRQYAYNVPNYCYMFIADNLVESRFFVSNKGAASLFPLYLYPPDEGKKTPKATIALFSNDDADPFAGKERIENIAPEFRSYINQKYPTLKNISPEQILGYIYAILHSNNYRTKYAEFLKRDFPHIPFVDDVKIFTKLAKIGQALYDAHLLKTIPQIIKSKYAVAGDNIVTTPRHNAVEARLYINKTQYFSNISAEIYAFHIGGYQVLDKYLKSRKGRALNLDDIVTIKHTAEALAFTITQMQKIDKIFIL